MYLLNLVSLAVLASTANAQFTPTLDTVEAIADNNVAEAQEYAHAAAALPSVSSMSQGLSTLNERERARLGGNTSSGCVRDLTTGACMSFLQQKASPIASAIRPLVQRALASGPNAGDYERKTQAPLVWMKFHHVNMPSSFLSEPQFPGNAASAGASISETLRNAAAASRGKNDVTKAVVAQAKSELLQQAKAENQLQDMRNAAFNIVHEALLRVLHNGGCPRDYNEMCPLGWSNEGNTCTPNAAYEGPCSATSLAGYSAAKKEEFALSCQASWACAA